MTPISARSDPRSAFVLPERDAAALRFIGKGYEVAQYQLHEAVFPGRSPTVVSRFVRRWERKGLLISERLHGFGMNRLRLTRSGKETLLLRGGEREAELFVPRKPVALKDLAHTLWINDARVVLGSFFPRATILPAWALGRIQPTPPVVPDVLALVRTKRLRPGLALAVEIDLGGEPLTRVFLPKLKALRAFLSGIPETHSAVVVLTSGSGRRANLVAALHDENDATPTAVEVLPQCGGREGLMALGNLFRPLVDANPQPEGGNPRPCNNFAASDGTGFALASEANG